MELLAGCKDTESALTTIMNSNVVEIPVPELKTILEALGLPLTVRARLQELGWTYDSSSRALVRPKEASS